MDGFVDGELNEELVYDFDNKDKIHARTYAMKIMQQANDWIVIGKIEDENGHMQIARSGIASPGAYIIMFTHLFAQHPDLRAALYQLLDMGLDNFKGDVAKNEDELQGPEEDGEPGDP